MHLYETAAARVRSYDERSIRGWPIRAPFMPKKQRGRAATDRLGRNVAPSVCALVSEVLGEHLPINVREKQGTRGRRYREY